MGKILHIENLYVQWKPVETLKTLENLYNGTI